jgi:hypothetical protein
MILDRRNVLKLLPLAVSSALAGETMFAASPSATASLSFDKQKRHLFHPLDKETLLVSGEGWLGGFIVLHDGRGREYLRAPAEARVPVQIGGALGMQRATLLNVHGGSMAELTFTVDCDTAIDDDGGPYGELLSDVVWTLMSWNQNAPVNSVRYEGRTYELFVNWIFDHTLTLKGMKYFWPNLKDAVDLFAETQREDGMIWENYYPAVPGMNYFDWKFHYGNFVRRFGNGFWQLRRAPVESHVEQFFIEALYSTWKATGDTDWMETRLDAALRAIHYATTDPFRWSEKYKLMHRGFTIDTWDYVSDDQQRWGESVFVVYPGKSEFGVFHGDNTNLIAQLHNLSEMLVVAGRAIEAEPLEKFAAELEVRLNALSWNGNFYTHWIAENTDYKPDVGVDMSKQVSLSNAYALNRGISQERCVAILKTYQQIRSEMPATSPGEFYGIYPPFLNDFTQNSPGLVWEYVNGGVLTVVAGELAHGAFEHGYEAYGADILRRLKDLSQHHRGYLPVTLRGKAAEVPERSFDQISIASIANACHGHPIHGVPVWSDDPSLTFAQIPVGSGKFQGVPFEVLDPAVSPFHSCVIVSRHAPYASIASLRLDRKASSVYLLHAAEGAHTGGMLTFRYADGTSESQYMETERNMNSWVFPSDTQYSRDGPRTEDSYRVAWRTTNQDQLEFGVYATGINNPHVEREISALEFTPGEGKDKWLVLAVTCSSAPVFFPPFDDQSTGIPDGWTASVVYALLEGLAGVKDRGAAFSKTALSPRWESAGVGKVKVAVRYPASEGYCSYQYLVVKNQVSIDFTGSAEVFDLEVLLPSGASAGETRLNGQVVRTTTRKIESSLYLMVPQCGGGVHRLQVQLEQRVIAD